MKYTILITIFLFCIFSCNKDKKTSSAGLKMQDFVINISNYARLYDSDFIVIPQNGIELAFNNLNQEEGINSLYLNSVDGFGVEELFYNGSQNELDERLNQLQILKENKKIMVAEYVSDLSNISDAINKNTAQNFICFPRENGNYDYSQIPNNINQENSNNILKLSDAKNYLYLINPENFSSKQQFLTSIANTNFDVILIDLFFEEEMLTNSDIDQLRTKANGGQRLVISYMNIGSAEKFRYYWNSKWKLHNPIWVRKKYDGYKDEFWVQYWNADWQNIIFGNNDSYMNKIINTGFDGVYLDNVEAYYFLYHKK